jgi:predicted ATPase
VPLAVADAVGVPLDGADPNAAVRSRLLSYLANRRLLLVLDNCEHVVDAVAVLVDEIVGSAEQVTVLATSREALASPVRCRVSIPPLAVPPEGTVAGRVLEYPAAALFVERARCRPREPGPPDEDPGRAGTGVPTSSTGCRSRSSSPPHACRRCRCPTWQVG